MITKEQVIEVAKQCFDPEIPVNIWDLGLVYEIEIHPETEDIQIKMSLTSAGCPSAQQIPNDFKNKIIEQLKAKNVDIKIVFDPPWTPERISEDAKRKLGLLE